MIKDGVTCVHVGVHEDVKSQQRIGIVIGLRRSKAGKSDEERLDASFGPEVVHMHLPKLIYLRGSGSSCTIRFASLDSALLLLLPRILRYPCCST